MDVVLWTKVSTGLGENSGVENYDRVTVVDLKRPLCASLVLW